MTVPIKAHETAAVVVVSESAAAADCSSHLFISQNLSLSQSSQITAHFTILEMA